MRKVNSEFEIVEDKKARKSGVKVDRSGWEYVTSPGIYLMVPILGCLAFGVWLDGRFASKPLYTIIFLIAGVVSSVYNLSKLTRNP